MLHCIEQTKTEGGLSHYVDAFHAAHLLHQEDPEAFKILVTTPISFYNECNTDYGDFNTACRRNLIRSVTKMLSFYQYLKRSFGTERSKILIDFVYLQLRAGAFGEI